jgi:uncharacterized protein (DUF2147 family)
MKKIIILPLFFFHASITQVLSPDNITGIWITDSKEAKIKIYKSGDTYYGQVIWLKEPNDAYGHPKKDIHNPDPRKRDDPALGMLVLKNLIYQSGVWSGIVYGPKRGKEAECELRLKGNDTLEGTAHYGLLSGTRIWTRSK